MENNDCEKIISDSLLKTRRIIDLEIALGKIHVKAYGFNNESKTDELISILSSISSIAYIALSSDDEKKG